MKDKWAREQISKLLDEVEEGGLQRYGDEYTELRIDLDAILRKDFAHTVILFCKKCGFRTLHEFHTGSHFCLTCGDGFRFQPKLRRSSVEDNRPKTVIDESCEEEE